MDNQQKRHVFISYVRENSEQVQKLCDELTKHGVKVWLDRNDIKPGSRWKDAIRKAIREGDFFIACFSKEYAAKGKTHMNEEMVLATEELRKYPPDRGWFIPVLLSKCDIPARMIGAGETLLDFQWVSLYEDWEAGIRQILSAIKPISPEVRNLLIALLSRDLFVRENAINALAEIGDPAAVPALIECMQDKNGDVRRQAIIALRKIGDPAAVPALIEALKGEKYSVAALAAFALQTFGSSSVPALIEVLKYENYMAIDALGKIGDSAAVPALIECLQDKDYRLRAAVSFALGKIGDPAAVPALIKCLQDEDLRLQGVSMNALREIGTIEALRALQTYKKSPKQK